MNALPHASATGAIHSGTMTGKLNGVMPATTPSGSRSECESTPPETCGVFSPLSSWPSPQANSTTSRPRVTSPRASDEHLAVLARDQRGELVAVGVDQLAEGEHHLRALA